MALKSRIDDIRSADETRRFGRRSFLFRAAGVVGGVVTYSVGGLATAASASQDCRRQSAEIKSNTSCRVQFGGPSTCRSCITVYSKNGSWVLYNCCITCQRAGCQCGETVQARGAVCNLGACSCTYRLSG